MNTDQNEEKSKVVELDMELPVGEFPDGCEDGYDLNRFWVAESKPGLVRVLDEEGCGYVMPATLPRKCVASVFRIFGGLAREIYDRGFEDGKRKGETEEKAKFTYVFDAIMGRR